MKDYQNLLRWLLINGDRQYNERTGNLMIGRNKYSLGCDLREGFPALTTKQLFFNSAAEEMFWMLRGERSIKTLVDKNIPIWNGNVYDLYLRRHNLNGKIKKNTKEWDDGFNEFVSKIKNDPKFAEREGDFGPGYGYQWRHWKTRDGKEIDQFKGVIDKLKKDKGTRYAVMHAWNPEDLGDMALAPCHVWYQYSVWEDKFLDLHMVQRSCDTFLGVPFNRVGPAIQQYLVANELGLEARDFDHTLINVHLYAGVPPRSQFLRDDHNLNWLRQSIKDANREEDYLSIRSEYINRAPEEGEIHNGKDHIPFVLEQLSKKPYTLPRLEMKTDGSIYDLIQMPARDVFELKDYQYHKWDSKARMAA